MFTINIQLLIGENIMATKIQQRLLETAASAANTILMFVRS